MYTNSYKTCSTRQFYLRAQKHNLLASRRLRGLVVFVFAHDAQIQVAHALCKQGCRLISYTANKRIVTIEACCNCHLSPLCTPLCGRSLLKRCTSVDICIDFAFPPVVYL